MSDVEVKTAINTFSLMSMGLVDTAAVRIAKQWEDKCAEADKLRAALYDAREFVDAYKEANAVWAKDRLDKIDAALTQEQR